MASSTCQAEKDILHRVFRDILELEDNSNLHKACERDDVDSIASLLGLSPAEIMDLTYLVGTTKTNITKEQQGMVTAMQMFLLKRASDMDSIHGTWSNVTLAEFNQFRVSAGYISSRAGLPNPVAAQSNFSVAPSINPTRPTPPPDITKDGEQYCHWGDLDAFKSIDVDEFEAAMLCSADPPCCLEKDTTPTTDNPIIEALEDAILFFETFCLTDDFTAHSMDDETNVLGTTVETVPIVATMAVVATNKDRIYSPHALVMKYTMVHIEYPDRTKFVSSMNHEQYEELKTYSDLDGGASVSVKICPIGTTLNDCVMLVPIRDVGE